MIPMPSPMGRAILRIGSKLRGEPLFECYALLLRADRSDADERARLRLLRLTELARVVRDTVPAFRDCDAPAAPTGNTAEDLGALLGKFPVLTKERILRSPGEFVSIDRRLRGSGSFTSGSTGQPFRFVTDQFGAAAARAAVWRALRRFGVLPGDPCVRVWGVQADLRRRVADRLVDACLNRRTIGSHRIDATTAKRFADSLRGGRIRWLYGFASAVGLLSAKYGSFSGESPTHDRTTVKPGLRAIILTGEKLATEARQRIETELGAPVCEEYGSTETGPIAHGCEHGSLHVNEENVILECESCEEILGINEHGCTTPSLLVTELNNRAMPVIRYALGDRVQTAGGRCKCGRDTLRITEVMGRELDSLQLPDGSTITGTMFEYLPKYAHPEIAELQFVQERPGDVTVLYVTSMSYNDVVLDRLRRAIDQLSKGGLTPHFQRTDFVPREPSGKIKLVRRMQAPSRLG